jgi:serine phosphatase RsbU (regulator of sigma subunit)
MYTDGITNAGDRYGGNFDLCTLLESLLEEQEPSAQQIADALLSQAMRLDQNRPNDDMSVVVLRVMHRNVDQVRRMMVTLPVGPASND